MSTPAASRRRGGFGRIVTEPLIGLIDGARSISPTAPLLAMLVIAPLLSRTDTPWLDRLKGLAMPLAVGLTLLAVVLGTRRLGGAGPRSLVGSLRGGVRLTLVGLVVFAAGLILSVVFSAYVANPLNEFAFIGIAYGCYFLFTTLFIGAFDTVERLTRAADGVLVTGWLIAVGALPHLLLGIQIYDHDPLRVSGVFWDSNYFGAFLVVTILFAGSRLLYGERRVGASLPWVRRRPVLWALIGLCLLILPFTYSRSSLLMLPLAGFLVLWIGRRRREVIISGLIVIAALPVVFSYVAEKRSGSQADKIGGYGLVDLSSFKRVLLILGAVQMFESSPLTGIGSRQSVLVYEHVYSQPLEPVKDVNAIHGWPFEAFAELGLIGGGGLVLMFAGVGVQLGWSGRRWYRLTAEERVLIASVTGIWVMEVFFGSFAVPHFYYEEWFWAPFALEVAVVRVIRANVTARLAAGEAGG